MPGLNMADTNGRASGSLKDGWRYQVERIPVTNRFHVTVVHPYGDEPSGGVPWPIEDPDATPDPAHPTYSTVEGAIAAARAYLERLSDLRGYPDPDKMSARGFRPALW